ncbi:MAG: ATP-binding protein [Sulfuricellaceae bacterium]
MKLLDNIPIKRKLMLIGLVTNGVAVILLSITLGVGEWVSYRSRAMTTLAVHAGVIADNAAPALMFSDENAAREVLASLGKETSIVYAALHGKNGGIIAQFQLAGQRRQPPAMPASGEYLFFAGQLIYAKNVVHSGDTVGILYLQSDLSIVFWELLKKLLLIAAAMTLSLAVALFLFTRLQKAISGPVNKLVEAMTHVTQKNDYSVQVPVQSRDEFGLLAQGFNAMLAAIRDRETALGRYQAGLEDAVRQRTEELKQLNASLELRVQEEVAKNREKDHLLIQQSRFAALGEMIGNIAHQWRQPINALTILLANIKDAYEFNELSREYLDKSVKTGQTIIQRMSTTIDDFRNFFKPNKEKARFSVNEAVADALNILEAAFKSNNIAVSVEQDESVMAYGYRNEYSQVLINLLSNAKEAIQQRHVAQGQVRIAIANQAGRAVVAVEDNAGGIPPDVLPRVFDPYFTTKEKGTGIGLYMSKMIIEHNMDGSIKASNIEGGCKFVVTVVTEATEATQDKP